MTTPIIYPEDTDDEFSVEWIEDVRIITESVEKIIYEFICIVSK